MLVGVPFIFYFILFLFLLQEGFYCWVIILIFSSFSIILFAVDLSFMEKAINKTMSTLISWRNTVNSKAHYVTLVSVISVNK